MTFAKAKLNFNGTEDCKALLDLKGKTIVDIGFAEAKVEGGLTIDYRDGNKIKRVVLGHNDLGTWIQWFGIKGQENQDDTLKEKIKKAENKNRCFSSSELTIVDDSIKRCFRFIGDSAIQGDSKTVYLILTVSEIKLLPDTIRQYFMCRSNKERLEMMKAKSGLKPKNEHEFTRELLCILYIWAQF